MDWGKVLGKLAETALSGAAYTVVVNKWMTIEDLTDLRLKIRSDIRYFNAENITVIERSLRSMSENYASVKDRRSRDQAIMVREIFMDEAARRGL